MAMGAKYFIIAFLGLVFASSCDNTKQAKSKLNVDYEVAKFEVDTIEYVSNLEELYSYAPKYTVIETCDLSHLGLKEIPPLRDYNIKRLDLSNNELRWFRDYRSLLPPSVEELYLDSCNIGNKRREDEDRGDSFSDVHVFFPGLDVYLDSADFPNLRKVDVSYNRVLVIKTPKNAEVIKVRFNKGDEITNTVRSTAEAVRKIRPDTVETVKSLDEFYRLPPNTVIGTCDLSGQGLEELPLFSAYNIKRLDISDNDLSGIDPQTVGLDIWFPRTIEELHMRGCRFGEKWHESEKGKKYPRCIYAILSKKKLPHLKKVDMSGNSVNYFLVSSPAEHVDISRNELIEVSIRTNTVKYLDVSHNWDMRPYIGVPPQGIDTLKADSCAQNKLLEEKLWRLVGE